MDSQDADRIEPVAPVEAPATASASRQTSTSVKKRPRTHRPGIDAHRPGINNPFLAPVSTGYEAPPPPDYFRSRRVKKEKIEQPWLEKTDPRQKWTNIFPLVGFIIGLGVVGIFLWDSVRTVARHSYCEVFHDNFTSLNPSVWTKEVEVGGYGNGQFEMTTNTDENVFIKDGILIIKPTIQEEKFITNNHTIDLRGHGCTGSDWIDCVATTNTTNSTIVNPIKSGRINTKLGASIKYGRLEVVAKLPVGDWLWPAIFMLPMDNVYGPWPRSGEIDIMESRGNAPGYKQGGNNIVSSALHFGPDAKNNGWWKNNVKRKALHTNYAANYNTFGIEWSEKYIFTYINTRLLQVMYTHFDEPFFKYGNFPLADRNGTRIENPWKDTHSNTSPFDQDFYLVISLAAGSTNGWFEDGKSGKPWIDRSPRAKLDFWEDKDQWLPTWKDGGPLMVKSVTMWQESGHKGCKA
ncbi:concanavalin A-like lectin/glucanase [Clathrospora elynae]|uniref:Concanavalin A-like lectin/glucanase n=1 Tax=Clathrospora elynae TaxID=706981 RepID=A0A6A5SQN2_9PLEO|nr:concanavalin A-like lectin/glucanase [Clathrospora elynae]